MRSTYKKLGPYIREVDVRNVEDRKTNLFGVSTQKVFMDSIANTVGTDFTKYKVVKRGQFTYVSDTSRRGDRIGLALLETHDWGLVSNVYTVFEIIDQDQLLPEYLMMWFRRPEFDRYARFKSHGSVRELFGWDEMCDVELPIPSIEKQREIVKEYQTVVDRIRLNERLNEKLEEAAQAIYKRWFVDFEFPISAEYAQSIGKPELEGQPYKSSGGEMEYNEVLKQEIPKGWEDGSVSSLAKAVICGKTPPTADADNYGSAVPFITIPDMHGKVYVDRTERLLSHKGADTQANKTLPVNAVCVSCIASPGLVALASQPSQTNQQINSVICRKDTSCFYTFFTLLYLGRKIKEWGIKGSVGANMNKSEFSAMVVLKASTSVQAHFHRLVEPLFRKMLLTQQQQHLTEDFQVLLNARMAVLRA